MTRPFHELADETVIQACADGRRRPGSWNRGPPIWGARRCGPLPILAGPTHPPPQGSHVPHVSRRSRRRPARVHRSRPAVRRASRRRRAPNRVPLLLGALAAAIIAVVLAAVLAPRSAEAQPAGITLLGTAPTTTDSRIDLPADIRSDLVDLALAC